MSGPVNSYYLCNDTGNEPLFYQVKPITALLMSLASWGLYTYWWHYKNWRLIKRNADATLSPLSRALFHPLFAYSLYDRVADTCDDLRVRGGLLLRMLGTMHVFSIALMFGAAADLFPILSMLLYSLTILDLVVVQSSVVKINCALDCFIKNKFAVIDGLAIALIAGNVLAFYWIAT